MKAKERFREGWIMLTRSFWFGELKEKGIYPLPQFTIVYAYAEKPIIEYSLDEEGKRLMKELDENYDKPLALFDRSKFRRGKWESDREYEDRIDKEEELIINNHKKVEHYQGMIVQAEILSEMCRFRPDEYTISSKQLIDGIFNDITHHMIVERENAFEQKAIKNMVFYAQQRGISKRQAKRWAARDLTDAVWFLPYDELLNIYGVDLQAPSIREQLALLRIKELGKINSHENKR